MTRDARGRFTKPTAEPAPSAEPEHVYIDYLEHKGIESRSDDDGEPRKSLGLTALEAFTRAC